MPDSPDSPDSHANPGAHPGSNPHSSPGAQLDRMLDAMPAVREHMSYHMTPEQFRQHGHAMVDWIAEYLATVEAQPVQSQVEPGEVRAGLPMAPPDEGESFERMMADVEEVILPGLTHWQSPHFFGYFPANTSGPAILGELLSAGLGVQGMIWATSPACTELESHVLDWLVDMLGLPEKFKTTTAGGGVIQDTASSASLCAMLAARERATGFASNQTGLRQPLVAYTSSQAHSSIEKAARIAGIGVDNLRLIEVDDAHAMSPDALAEMMRIDLEAGRRPFFICATVGTTSSNAIDPVRRLAEEARSLVPNIWLHVDAAMSGTAALCPEYRFIHDGLELADSYCFNPHKWMFTNFDCDCFYLADRSELIRTLSILPEYLRNAATESGAVFDYRDWQIPLGRRFRALKLWFVIRHYGVAGLQHHVRQHIALAKEFARWVEEDPDFILAAPVPLNLICLRHRRGDALTQQVMETINRSGQAFFTHTRLDDRYIIRVSIGGTQMGRSHVERAWKLLRETAQRLDANTL